MNQPLVKRALEAFANLSASHADANCFDSLIARRTGLPEVASRRVEPEKAAARSQDNQADIPAGAVLIAPRFNGNSRRGGRPRWNRRD